MKQYLGLLCIFFATIQGNARAQRAQTPPPYIFLASTPKCGTHLIKKCLGMMNHAHFNYSSPTFFNAAEANFKRRNNILSHAPYNDQLAQYISDYNFKGILMIRDPRDQAVSFIHFINKSGKIWSSLKSIPFDDALTLWITHTNIIKGTGRFNDPMMDEFGDIADFFTRYLPWMHHPNFITVRFEDLVGERGGGNDEVQKQTIQAIAHHIGAELSEEKLEKIMTNLFGRSHTFRKGVIGEWRTTFTPEHKELFKQIAGQLLIDLGYETDLNW